VTAWLCDGRTISLALVVEERQTDEMAQDLKVIVSLRSQNGSYVTDKSARGNQSRKDVGPKRCVDLTWCNAGLGVDAALGCQSGSEMVGKI
jgi:hypothetical protein